MKGENRSDSRAYSRRRNKSNKLKENDKNVTTATNLSAQPKLMILKHLKPSESADPLNDHQQQDTSKSTQDSLNLPEVVDNTITTTIITNAITTSNIESRAEVKVSSKLNEKSNEQNKRTNSNETEQKPIHPAVISLPDDFLLKDLHLTDSVTTKLIDEDNWQLQEKSVTEHLLQPESSSSSSSSSTSTSSPSFSVIGAIGKQSVGKSQLLNRLAGSQAFRTHFDADHDENEILLKHVTKGVDLHVTTERLFLLDSQPVLSASLLDDFLSDGHQYASVSNFDAESFIYITSLQLIAFMLATCDNLLIVNDWILDLHFVKLIATAQMLVGQSASRAELVFIFPAQSTPADDQLAQQIQNIVGKCTIVYECDKEDEKKEEEKIENDDKIVENILRLCAKRKAVLADQGRSQSSEKHWLTNASRYWENCVRKTSIFIDYGRFLPKINTNFS